MTQCLSENNDENPTPIFASRLGKWQPQSSASQNAWKRLCQSGVTAFDYPVGWTIRISQFPHPYIEGNRFQLATQVFGHRGTYSWSGSASDFYWRFSELKGQAIVSALTLAHLALCAAAIILRAVCREGQFRTNWNTRGACAVRPIGEAKGRSTALSALWPGKTGTAIPTLPKRCLCRAAS